MGTLNAYPVGTNQLIHPRFLQDSNTINCNKVTNWTKTINCRLDQEPGVAINPFSFLLMPSKIPVIPPIPGMISFSNCT